MWKELKFVHFFIIFVLMVAIGFCRNSISASVVKYSEAALPFGRAAHGPSPHLGLQEGGFFYHLFIWYKPVWFRINPVVMCLQMPYFRGNFIFFYLISEEPICNLLVNAFFSSKFHFRGRWQQYGKWTFLFLLLFGCQIGCINPFKEMGFDAWSLELFPERQTFFFSFFFDWMITK